MNIIFRFGEVTYKGWIYLDITKVWEPMHICTPRRTLLQLKKNTTFQERGITTGQGDAIASNDDTSPLS
jgi:hypothetical protein